MVHCRAGPTTEAWSAPARPHQSKTKPKGISRSLTHAPISMTHDRVVPLLESIGFGPGKAFLSPAPLYHAGPLAWTMAAQRLGGSVVVMERFDPRAALELIRTYRVTH